MKNNNIPIISSELLYNDLFQIISDSYVFNNPNGIIDLAKSSDYNAYHRYMYTYIPALLSDIYCRLQRENGVSNMYNMSMYSSNTSLILDHILSKINYVIAYYLNDIIAFVIEKSGFSNTALDYNKVL
jgi:hypothetical protein